MANLHVAVETGSHIKKSMDAILSSVLDIPRSLVKETKETVTVPVSSTSKPRKEVIKVLDRAADDDDFMARLTYEGSKALQGYNLTLEEKGALLSGDIKWIEAHVGKLDDRLSTWLWRRLQQEIW